MISIFTPTHDPRFLRHAYESLCEQTIREWEWVVLYNNGAIPINFNDARVKEFELDTAPEWVGPLKAAACKRATGDILLELDHDDLLMPTALEEVEIAFADPNVGFVYSNTIHATETFEPLQRFDERFGWRYRVVNYKGHDLDEHISFKPAPDSLSKIWFAPNHLRAFRRSAYDVVGGYAKKMRVLDDLDIMCKLYLHTTFRHIDKGLYIYRVHDIDDANKANTWIRYNKEIQENVYRIHDQYIEQLACRAADLRGLRKIELGGGINPRSPELETVDLKNACIITNLNEKWPFADSSVGFIRAYDIFEHLRDPLHTMTELYRVLAPGGIAMIQIPSTDGRGAFQDPTHKSFWNENSFLYYTNRDFAQYINTPVRFQAARLYTTEKNKYQVCWVIAHLISLKEDYRAAGLIEI